MFIVGASCFAVTPFTLSAFSRTCSFWLPVSLLVKPGGWCKHRGQQGLIKPHMVYFMNTFVPDTSTNYLTQGTKMNVRDDDGPCKVSHITDTTSCMSLPTAFLFFPSVAYSDNPCDTLLSWHTERTCKRGGGAEEEMLSLSSPVRSAPSRSHPHAGVKEGERWFMRVLHALLWLV